MIFKITIFVLIILSKGSLLFAQLTYQQKKSILEAHNKYRSEVGVSALAWSDTLAISATKWAGYLAENNLFEHSNLDEDQNQGENLWIGTQGTFDVIEMVDDWGNEKRHFRYRKIKAYENPNRPTGHYTQIVWKTTTLVGCALRTSDEQLDILVCHYAPAGNIIGYYPY